MSSLTGILLAGGAGTRLHPLTATLGKHRLAVYDQPMVFYSLSLLAEAGVANVVVVTTADEAAPLRMLLADGSQWGMSLSYVVQPHPGGVAQAYLVAAPHIHGRPTMLVLGDTFLLGVSTVLRAWASQPETPGAAILALRVADASPYGVVVLDAQGQPARLEEKPRPAGPGLAIPGVYMADADAVDVARGLVPSARGELEIVDFLEQYRQHGALRLHIAPPRTRWRDLGDSDRIWQAASLVRRARSAGRFLGNPALAAHRSGLIDRSGLQRYIASLPAGPYRDALSQAAPSR